METEPLKAGDKVIWHYDEDDKPNDKTPFVAKIVRFDSGENYTDWLVLNILYGVNDPYAYSYDPKYAKKVTDEEIMLWRLSND